MKKEVKQAANGRPKGGKNEAGHKAGGSRINCGRKPLAHKGNSAMLLRFVGINQSTKKSTLSYHDIKRY